MSDILANRRTLVGVELGNRADILTQGTAGAPSRVDNWLWQSYLNLAMSYKFDGLEQTVNGQWVQNQASIDYPPDVRRIDNISFYRKDGTALKINWKDIAYIRKYPDPSLSLPSPGNPLPSLGPPSIVCDFGQQIFVRPFCDSAGPYNFYLDYWQKPQQVVGGSATGYTSLGVADIGATVFNVPDDWLEIIDYGAMMRGHASLGEVDKSQALQQLLFGFTIPTTNKFVPGIIAQMWTRRQAQAPMMDYNIQPRQPKRSYTNVG
jgi:hypothetical protein